MKKYKIINLATALASSIFIFVLVLAMANEITQNSSTNNKNVTETNYAALNNLAEMKENITEFTIDFELENLTIKENEQYKITSFIPENVETLLKHIDYNYKDKNMSNYRIAGKYEIVIIFKDVYNREIEKTCFLIIEKAEEVPKIVKKSTQTQTKNNSEIINTTNSSPKQTNTLPKTSSSQTNLESQILKNDKNLGSYGRIYFSSLYSVALYTPTNAREAQQMVDNVDSAVIYRYGNIKIIADHANQGFSIIKSQNVGDYVYIKTLSTDDNYALEKYVVKEKTNGKNTKSKLITNDNRDIGTDVNHSLALYTCNTKDGYNITILLLDKA